MFCEHCGKEVNPDAEVCLNCGCRIKNSKKQVTTQDDQTANTICIVSLVCTFAGSFIFGILGDLSGLENFFDTLAGFSSLFGVALMVYARITYPNNKFAKVLMWIYIGLIALIVLLVILLIVFGILFFTSLAK